MDSGDREASPSELVRRLAEYRIYLESVRGQMPESAYAFAMADWHYDHSDHRCLHDAWVRQVDVKEVGSGARLSDRHVDLGTELLGAYQDGLVRLQYIGVEAYLIELPQQAIKASRRGHGDWLIDEVSLNQAGGVRHEVFFSTGARWIIDCADLICEWHSLGSMSAGLTGV
jgi:hypothetical protein